MFSHARSEVATSGPMFNGAEPLCAEGSALIREFQAATEIRATSRDCLLLASANREACEDRLRLAKRKYSNTLVAWITHRAFCVECRVPSADQDLMEFASF